MLLDATTLCATCWMHGVFATLLTIGNTSFHKLFSAARDHSRGRTPLGGGVVFFLAKRSAATSP
jgi:hypothetical protein